MSDRPYSTSVETVFSHLGRDWDSIRTLAEKHGQRSDISPSQQKLINQTLLQEIDNRDTLCDLSRLYKRLKSGGEANLVVFDNIILKMLRIATKDRLSQAA